MEHTLFIGCIKRLVHFSTIFVLVCILIWRDSSFQLVVKQRISFKFLHVTATVHVGTWFFVRSVWKIWSVNRINLFGTSICFWFFAQVITIGSSAWNRCRIDFMIFRFRSRSFVSNSSFSWVDDFDDFIFNSLMVISFSIENSSLINGNYFLLTLTVLSNVIFSFFENQNT